MPVLAPEQASELHKALVAAFDTNSMTGVVRFSLGERLDVIVNVQQGFDAVVAALLAWAEQRGPGTVEQLLRGVASARPDDRNVHDFCTKYFPKALEKLDSAAVIHTVNVGLMLLIGMKDQPAVRETVGRFRSAFETASEQMLTLKKYKGLHDTLHELQIRLGAIEDALARSKSEKSAVRTLGGYAVELKWFAGHAREQIPGLPSLLIEQDWIDDFENCVREMEGAARSRTDVDPELLEKIAQRLRSLLREAPRINTALANSATSLRLGHLSETMDVIAERIRPAADAGDETWQQLGASSVAVAVLSSRLEGLVSEHYEWQLLNKELDAAEISPRHQPQARMPKWQQFKDKLTGLCDLYPNEAWSRDLRERMALWMASTPSPEPGEVEKAAGQNAFGDFYRACILRFYDVDAELNSLCKQMTEVALPLHTLLTLIK